MKLFKYRSINIDRNHLKYRKKRCIGKLIKHKIEHIDNDKQIDNMKYYNERNSKNILFDKRPFPFGQWSVLFF